MNDPMKKNGFSNLDLLVALPAYNEEAALGKLIENILALLPQNSGILIVDDGSKDSTASIVEKASSKGPVALIKHGTNKGLGAAVRTLFIHGVPMLAERGKLVLMDADGTHTPDQIAQLKAKSEQGYDLVVCGRYVEGGQSHGVPGYRRFLSVAARCIVSIFLGELPAKDITSGYRMYDAKLLRAAMAKYGDRFVTTSGFGVMVEILSKLTWIGANVAEVPLILRYDLKKGASKMRLFKTFFQYLRLLAALRVERKALTR